MAGPALGDYPNRVPHGVNGLDIIEASETVREVVQTFAKSEALALMRLLVAPE